MQELEYMNQEVDDFLNLFDDPSIQRCDFDRWPLAEADDEMYSGLVFHVWGRLAGGERKNFCAVLQLSGVNSDIRDIRSDIELKFVNFDALQLLDSQTEKSMLIPVFQVSNEAEERGSLAFSAFGLLYG